ncbi:hypothetical protein ACIA5G_37120 [Amycolatopsis sp. NPDC051758]|uniref:hypothetical protein n=1 Tax=Amycolatopsis sp. NPDC051758 TaxID=3363935 RepID=UPI0037AF5BF3
MRGRLAKAEQFWEVARDLLFDRELGKHADAYVTLCVHAGIAAADALCCAGLGEHAQGESHNDAVELLAKVDKDAGRALSALLKMKTKAGYTHTSPTVEEAKRAGRSAETLVLRARQRVPG